MHTNADDPNDDARTTLRNLISESESLLAALGEEGTQRYRSAVSSLQRQIRRALDDLDDMQYSAVRRTRMAARRADQYVQSNPWKTAAAAVAVGAAVGAIVALVLARR